MVMRPALLLLLALGCNSETGSPAPADENEVADPVVPEMDPAALLTRVSLDLRGTRPTIEEIEQVEADPSALDPLIDAYMDDPRFEERLVDFWAEVYLTRADFFFFGADDFGRSDEAAFARSVGEEPLRLAARVIVEDLPWTEVVTADWTMANDLLVDIWPVERIEDPGSEDGWSKARYTDARPAAGVLASNGLWWRYQSTDSNANRKRANQVSRILLCNDYLVRPLSFDRNLNLLDQEAVESAIRNDPACVNCHNSLDPMAAYLFGFWTFNSQSWVDASTYHPERELLWQDYLGTGPAWYGTPGSSLVDLGNQVAADPRFAECIVDRIYTGFLRRESGLDDAEALTAHREAFLAGGLSVQSLIKSVIADPRYRAADSANPVLDEVGATPRKMVTADQLASQVQDLTGFAWTYGDYEMLGSDLYGLRTLAGGADGQSVTRNASSPNATLVLVQERLAEAAASHVLVNDLQAATPAERRLFTEIDFTETPDGAGRDAMVRQIQALHLRIFGKRIEADGEEIEANLGLWQDLRDVTGDARLAWVGLLTALLRDPDFLLY